MIEIIKQRMNKKSLPKQAETKNIRQLIPIKGFEEGILVTKNDHIAFIEVMPINMKLKADQEQMYITQKYEELLMTIKVPFYVFTIAKKADTKEHLDYVNRLIEKENVESVKVMAEEYKEYVEEISKKNTVKRRFIVAIPYQGVGSSYSEINAWLYQQCITYKEGINKCGNEAIITSKDNVPAQIIYELLNVRRAERGRIAE